GHVRRLHHEAVLGDERDRIHGTLLPLRKPDVRPGCYHQRMNAEAAMPLALAVSPQGEIHLDPRAAEIVPGAIGRRFVADFERGELPAWFAERNPAWNVVGRIVFHLAENKADAERPFAFLDTYTTRLSKKAEPQHRPLGLALRDFAKDRAALLALLLPVQ